MPRPRNYILSIDLGKGGETGRMRGSGALDMSPCPRRCCEAQEYFRVDASSIVSQGV